MAVALALVACTGSDGDADVGSTTTEAPSTSAVTATTTTVPVVVTAPPTTVAAPIGLAADDVLPALGGGISLEEPSSLEQQELAGHLRSDEELADAISSVAVRRAIVDGVDVGVVVAVALDPALSVTPAVHELLLEGFRSGGAVSAGALRVGPEELPRIRTEEAASAEAGRVVQLLWRHENVEILFAGGSTDIEAVARALVDAVAGPFPVPTTTTTAPPTTEDPPAADADAPSS